MNDYLQGAVFWENPPWSNHTLANAGSVALKSSEPTVAGAPLSVFALDRPIIEPFAGHATLHIPNANFNPSLTDLLRAKLDTIDVSRSATLNRQVLLARYDSPGLRLPSAQIELLESTLCSPLNVYGPGSQFQIIDYRVHCSSRKLLLEYLRSAPFQYSRILILHFFWNLIDRIADYWNARAQAWASWIVSLVLIAFRQQLKSGLGFKPRHRPLVLLRSSLHPIESAA